MPSLLLCCEAALEQLADFLRALHHAAVLPLALEIAEHRDQRDDRQRGEAARVRLQPVDDVVGDLAGLLGDGHLRGFFGFTCFGSLPPGSEALNSCATLREMPRLLAKPGSASAFLNRPRWACE